MESSGGEPVGGMTEEKRLGRVLAAARKRVGLTQQGLCHKSGLSYSTLAKIERGAIKAPSVFTIKHLAATLEISLDELLQGVSGGKQMHPTAENDHNGRPPVLRVSKNGVRFVFFDMNGCLVHGATTRAFTRLSEESGVAFETIETLYWQHNNAVCRGDVSIDQLNTVLAERLHMMVDWNRYYLECVQPTPGMDELVAWAAENYQVGILTNAMPGQVGPMLERGILPNVPYAAIVDSSEVHALKPENRMYEIAAERAGVSPSELLLVDDDRVNLGGAAALGWHTMGFDAFHPEESSVAGSTALQPAD
jgi:FMN phosphatase YigB (HAD superfamily)/transcriptional regulator with XRE-family HTH domain